MFYIVNILLVLLVIDMKKSMETTRRTTTSIKVNPHVWKDAKIEAIRYDMTVSELLEQALTEWVDKKRKEEKR